MHPPPQISRRSLVAHPSAPSRPSRAKLERLQIHLFDTPHSVRHVETVSGSHRANPGCLPELGVVEHCAQCVTERGGVSGWYEQPLLTIGDDLRHTSDRRCDTWKTGSH